MLLTGPEGSGKTTLLYSQILRKKEWKATPSLGFNFEELEVDSRKACIWDVGGNEPTAVIKPSIYKNIMFSGIIYVIEYGNPKHMN